MTPAGMTRHDRIAPVYDRLEGWLERGWYAQWRARLWAMASGPLILEVGMGTGKNVAFFPRDASVVAIDYSSGMLSQARRRIDPHRCALARMDVQRLGFPDAVFDGVVGTFVFGSVSDPTAGLREARRVTKLEGRLLLLEFVRPSGPLGFLVDLVDRMTWLVYGAHINRPTVDAVRAAGWVIERDEPWWRGAVRLIVARRTDGVDGGMPVSRDIASQTLQ